MPASHIRRWLPHPFPSLERVGLKSPNFRLSHTVAHCFVIPTGDRAKQRGPSGGGPAFGVRTNLCEPNHSGATLPATLKTQAPLLRLHHGEPLFATVHRRNQRPQAPRPI